MKRFTTEHTIGTMLPAVLLLVFAADIRSQIDTENFGTWSRGTNPSIQPYKGIEGSADWAHVEPESGVFDWSTIDETLKFAAANGLPFICSINVGFSSPEWLYTNGVPKVMTEGHGRSGPYPYYLDPMHVSFYHRLIERFGKHIRTLPADLASRVVSVQVKTGATGDEAPYKGTPTAPQYDIEKDGPAWRDFRLAAFEKYDIAFQHGPGPKIPLLFNGCGPDKNPVEWKWIVTHITAGLGHKVGGIGQHYQLQDEATRNRQFKQYFIDPPAGLHLYNRCEQDQGWKSPRYAVNTRMSFYWTALSALHAGLSRWTITGSARQWCAENHFWEHGRVFNEYARQIFSDRATRAMCVLRDGLDSKDTERFPEAQYGEAIIGNKQRYINICKAFASKGARMDSPAAVTKGQMYQRKTQRGLNDAGWGIFPGNYERFLHQVNANETSVGWWRVGGITESSPIYNRFARGFDNASGKNTMYFDIKDSFFSNMPLNGACPVALSVIYYDQGIGKWALKYDAIGNPEKTSLIVTKTGSGIWKEVVVTLNDAYFGNRCPHQSDIMLVSVDSEDDIFHMIELERKPRHASSR